MRFKLGLLAGFALLSTSSCNAETRSAKPFTVSGVVTDTKGRPLEGAEVSLNADFLYGQARVTTGADGRYEIGDLIKATYRASAWIKTGYAGGVVCQRLGMDRPSDYNSFPVSEGAVRNFRWQLTGEIGATDTFYGAQVQIWDFDSDVRAKSRAVEFTLTPTGPLVDGSTGAVIVREAALDYPASDDGIYDIPLGTYRMTAELISKDGGRTPLALKGLDAETYAPEIDLVWQPEARCGFGFDSGVAPFFVQIAAR
jgi:hypothetical protein